MNNFGQLSGGDGTKFLLRWRGRVDGPHSASIIEAKLATNEIGLLHEILHNGQWLTIRDYIAHREAVLRAEREAKEEQERRARQEAERQAKEREEQRRIEQLEEERRRTAQRDSLQAQNAGVKEPLSSTQQGSSSLKTFGTLLIFIGLAAAAYFFLAFDTSVESGVGRVHNLGLLADRQNGILVGVGLAIVGTIMLAVGSRPKP